jgi:predicted transcriptional regulator
MPSGTRLTLEQFDKILKLAGAKTEESRWRYSYSEIARRMHINERTVREVIRFAAAKFGEHAGWRDERSS